MSIRSGKQCNVGLGIVFSNLSKKVLTFNLNTVIIFYECNKNNQL